MSGVDELKKIDGPSHQVHGYILVMDMLREQWD